jgi:hypothetical protein
MNDADDYAGLPARPDARPLPYLAAGQLVTITSTEAGTSHGRVLDTATPDALPDLPGFDHAQVHAILREWEVRQIAFIEHAHNRHSVMFAALGDGRGNWRDLRGAVLSIEADRASEN